LNEPIARAPERAMDGKSPRILVVDDGITMRMYYRSVLEAAGFEVEEAINGMEGYEKALAQSFDMMIVDINMPKMDGYSMIRMIRNDPVTRKVPAIVVSTEATERDAVKALEAGANFYLVKPVAPEELVEAVRLMTGVAV